MITSVLTPPDGSVGAERRFVRSADGRLVGGVASGLAEYLGVSVVLVRFGFVLLTFASGAGVAGYAALWALAPQAEAVATPDPARAGARRPDRVRRLTPLLGVGGLAVGVILLLQRVGFDLAGSLTAPLAVVAVGVAVLWRVADDAQRDRWRAAAQAQASGQARGGWLRLAVGAALVVVGLVAMLAVNGGLGAAIDGLAAFTVVAVGAVAIAGPWLYRWVRDLRAERLERIREQERAEIAAHMHDSVLQTLTLVQRHANDPREVVRLARAEERALRGWLYDPSRATSSTFGPSLERLAAEVEERHRGTVDVVVVGDAVVDDALAATLQAAREAMVNAVKYAGESEPVSVYAEVSDHDVSVFVRDRGQGFDLAAVPADRRGVRESIIGRMERHKGSATVRSTGDGTEVELVMPRRPNATEQGEQA